jgi:hypothetical protein
MTQNEIMKRIIQGEFKLTQVVRNGHRPYYGDEYETIRTEVGVLRCLYFGENSKFCNPRYKK